MENTYEQEQVVAESQHRNKLDKCFFGKESTLKVQYDKDTGKLFLGVGRKGTNNDWIWETAKHKDFEAAEIIRDTASKN